MPNDERHYSLEIEDDETEEVPVVSEKRKPTWELSKRPHEHMTAVEEAAFQKLVAAEIAEAEKDLGKRSFTVDPVWESPIWKEELRYREQLLNQEQVFAKEREGFLIRIAKESIDIIKKAAREDDLDTIPGWTLFAIECIPYVSAIYAAIGRELRTKRDPKTDDVIGVKFEKMSAGRRAVYLTIGELGVSGKLAIAVTKILKRSVGRAVESAGDYAMQRAKEILS